MQKGEWGPSRMRCHRLLSEPHIRLTPRILTCWCCLISVDWNRMDRLLLLGCCSTFQGIGGDACWAVATWIPYSCCSRPFPSLHYYMCWVGNSSVWVKLSVNSHVFLHSFSQHRLWINGSFKHTQLDEGDGISFILGNISFNNWIGSCQLEAIRFLYATR
jgi:hypothetical protein